MRYRRASLFAPVVLPLVMLLALPGVTPAAADDRAGAPEGPGFLTGPSGGAPEDIAIDYLQEEAAGFGLSGTDVRELTVSSSYTSEHSGVTHVNVHQRYEGLDVFGSNATVNIAPDGSIIFIGDSFVPDLRRASGSEGTDAIQAVEAAAEGLGLAEPEDLAVVEGTDEVIVVSDGGISEGDIPVRLGWQPTERGLRLAHQVVIDETSDAALWNATVDAETGALLDVQNWTVSENAQDMASALQRSGADGAVGTASSGPRPSPQVEDGSAYRVYEAPKESPNDGPRTLVTNPADGLSSPYGWHDTDGAAGPEFTTTRGNNVHAYTDRDANNVPDVGGEPDGGADLQLDFDADLTEHPTTYTDAATTNLFYMNNVIHDVLYRYGFTEAAGNFQANNYGKGGLQGDYVRAEAQDGGGTNNANFSTPPEPTAGSGVPRMQMYLWTTAASVQPDPALRFPMAVTVQDGPAAGTHLGHFARYSPGPTNAGVSGTLVQPPAPTPSTGCTPYTVDPGSIVVVDATNTCNTVTQTLNAQNAGAAGVIVAQTGLNPGILSGSMANPPAIPTISVNDATGTLLKSALPVAARLHHNTALAPMRDGDFENGIIIHEYGHGVSNRLTGGPTINCLGGSEQMGEGWSDYLAISMLLDPALDDPEGPRGMGPYALYQPTREGNGIRPRPYSRNMAINPFTYDNIKTRGWLNGTSLATPHGVGFGWATVLWDMTWDLIDKHGFNPNIYEPWSTGGNNHAIQIVMDGMKMQGCQPTFVRARDAIIAADAALGGENHCLLWRSFARRGLGVSAVGGGSSRDDGSEAFDLPSECRARGSVEPGGVAVGLVEGRSTTPSLTISNLALEDGESLEWTVTEAAADCTAPSDLGWLSTDASSGSTPAAGTSQLAVSIDAAGLRAPDVHEGLVCLTSNDGTAPTIAIPVRLQVEFPTSGFGTPIRGAVTTRNAGSTTPVKFSLGGDRGLGILASGSPTSQPIDCTSLEPTGPATATRTAGGSTLTYDATTDSYTYPWRTEGTWAGTCRQLQVTLVDGTTHVASFRFV